MLAKRPNLNEVEAEELLDLSSTTLSESLADLQYSATSEPATKAENNVIAVDFSKSTLSPAKTSEQQRTWSDYEEFFPTAEVEAIEPITSLTPGLVNRRCYWRSYWPETQVFRIKEVDPDNNTVYLNLVYRWVSATDIVLLKALTPQRPPKGIELACGDLPF